MGNYIFAKQLLGVWQAIYVGQGNLRARYNAAIRERCVLRKGATHYHFRIDEFPAEHLRILEEQDIIEGNPKCKEENGGCNGVGP